MYINIIHCQGRGDFPGCTPTRNGVQCDNISSTTALHLKSYHPYVVVEALMNNDDQSVSIVRRAAEEKLAEVNFH